MDRYDMPSGRRTDGNGDFIGALLDTLQRIITRRAGVTPLPDTQTDRRFAAPAGGQTGPMPGPEAVRTMRGMLSPYGGAETRNSQGETGVPSGSDAAGDPLLERIVARLVQMGLVDADENGGAGGNGMNVARRPDGYR